MNKQFVRIGKREPFEDWEKAINREIEELNRAGKRVVSVDIALEQLIVLLAEDEEG